MRPTGRGNRLQPGRRGFDSFHPCHGLVPELAYGPDSNSGVCGFDSPLGYVKRLRELAWSAVIAALMLTVAGVLATVGVVENNRELLDVSKTLALVGIGFAVLSFRDQA